MQAELIERIKRILIVRIKHRYAVLKGRREWDIVRPPAQIQIVPELPTATVLYSGN